MTALSQRFSFDPIDRLILVHVGKVEIGQHVHHAFQTLVANRLEINLAHVRVSPVSTDSSPDDGLTAGSLSMQVTGETLRTDTITLRATLFEQAAKQLNTQAKDILLNGETLELSTHTDSCSIFDLPIAQKNATTNQQSDTDAGYPKTNSTIAASVLGERMYIQDLILPGMVYARALRCRDINLDDSNTIRIIKDGGFSAIVATTEVALDRAWSEVGTTLPKRDASCDGPVASWIKNRMANTTKTGDTTSINSSVFQSVSRPFLLHASIAPSCAIALLKDKTLTIWTHSQGIFLLRETVAQQTGLSSEQVVIRHVSSAGSYGHNAADDAAMDAVLVSLQMPGTPVRVLWTRQDEFQHSPIGAAMIVQAEVELSDDNSISHWRQIIWSTPHGQRPGGGGNVNLLGSIEKDPNNKATTIPDLPDAIGAGAARNAIPPYSINSFGLTTHLIQDLPVRTSSIRGLGAQMNVVCIEAIMEKLATRCEMNSLEFRLKHLDDSRAHAVLNRLKTILESASLSENEAIGIGYSRYKAKGAYAAVAIRLQLNESIELLDAWAVVDGGYIVDSSGAKNQIEGGIIQAASWTLCESALLLDGYVDAAGWEDYPIMSWSDIPRIHTTLIEPATALPSLGIGECMVGPVSAAIINGISSIAGSTIADLPLTRENFIRAVTTATDG